MIIILKNQISVGNGLPKEDCRYKSTHIVSYHRITGKYNQTDFYGITILSTASEKNHFFETKEDRERMIELLDNTV